VFRLTGIVLAVLLCAAGCSTPDTTNRERGEIIKVLEIRGAALNTKNLPRYVAVISHSYNDKGKDFTRLTEELKNNFAKFDRIAYEADTPSITVNGATADAAATYRMKVVVQGKELSLKGTERLRLAREPEGWKIIAGI
jgi:hypothetical protein